MKKPIGLLILIMLLMVLIPLASSYTNTISEIFNIENITIRDIQYNSSIHFKNSITITQFIFNFSENTNIYTNWTNNASDKKDFYHKPLTGCGVATNYTGIEHIENPFDDDVGTHWGATFINEGGGIPCQNEAWYSFNLTVPDDWDGYFVLNTSFYVLNGGVSTGSLSLKILNHTSDSFENIYASPALGQEQSLTLINPSFFVANQNDVTNDNQILINYTPVAYSRNGKQATIWFGENQLFHALFNKSYIKDFRFAIDSPSNYICNDSTTIDSDYVFYCNSTYKNICNQNNQYCNKTFFINSSNPAKVFLGLNITYLPYILSYNNEKILETSLQDFDITIANLTNTTAMDIALFYNGTFFNPDIITIYPGYTTFNYSFNLPKIIYPDNIYNYSFYFEYNHTYPTRNESRTSETLNQTVYQVIIDNCTKSSIETLNVIIHNESDDTLIDGTIDYVFDYWLASYQSLAQNASGTLTDNGTFCIYPNWTSVVSNILFDYTVKGTTYEYSAFELILDNVSQNIILYATDGTTRITFSVKDTSDNPIENAYIKVMKYDVDTDTFRTVELVKTNNDGEAIANLITYTEWYKFIVEYNGIVYLTTESTKIFSTTKNFIINLQETDWFGNYDVSTGVTTSLTFNNASKNFVFTWSDPNAAMHYGCLKVVKRSAAGDTLIDDRCIQSTASTILVNIGSDDTGTYIATGFLKFDELMPVEVLWKIFTNDKALFAKKGARDMGLFTSWMLSLTLAFVGIWNPAVAIVLMMVGLFATSMLQLWQIATPMLVTIILMGGIILFKMGRKQ